MESEFYIVATPIGNLSDISLRALDVLRSVDFIACEDTRVTGILAQKYDIGAKLFDCHKFNEQERSGKIISLIKAGKKVALVSDAGTPCISDPGSVLIKNLKENNVKITSVPGACAVTTFLTHLPRTTEEYAFVGFLPKSKKQQIEILNKHRYTNCVFYESPNRLIKTLGNIIEELGEDVQVAVGRELTKMFEEVKIGSAAEIVQYYKQNTLKGEIVAMVYAKECSQLDDEELKLKIQLLKDEGFSPKDISKIIHKLYSENKNKVYELSIQL